ncbi:uncharacterized protein LOC116254743 isoform X3 [Nymphaea colorata]|uniref:uncharacterized protein LOC116254743 isoform X3 n=1 Tax=Nymphaea colorata TaxID=210225 RepID=UPI00129E3B0C|nr:uncharacterized protein LOC116254743 isoform X3 [Nymphaea colorata]
MEGMVVPAGPVSPWSYQESIEDLKQTLLYTTLELESTRMAAKEEMKKNEESMKQLLQALKATCQERDEIKGQLQTLLDKLAQAPSNDVCHSLKVNLQPETPRGASRGYSGLSESDSLSETYKHHSYVSSPTDSFFESTSSPEFQNVNFAESVKTASENAGVFRSNERLIKVKPLPEKGKLLQAVLEAGPLLQTLLIAGPLPRWRNPPPLQSLQIPTIPIRGISTSTPIQTQVSAPLIHRQGSAKLDYHQDSLSIPPMSSGSLVHSSVMVAPTLKRPFLSSSVGNFGEQDPQPATKLRKF